MAEIEEPKKITTAILREVGKGVLRDLFPETFEKKFAYDRFSSQGLLASEFDKTQFLVAEMVGLQKMQNEILLKILQKLSEGGIGVTQGSSIISEAPNTGGLFGKLNSGITGLLLRGGLIYGADALAGAAGVGSGRS